MTTTEKRQALSHYDAYKTSTATSLRDAYGTYSGAKDDAWDFCKELMYKFNGYGLRIIAFNRYVFTAGFMFEEDGKQMFMYITPYKHLAVEVEA